MPPQDDPILEQLLSAQRLEAARRSESLGPMMAAAAMVRESCITTRMVLADLETNVVSHLEILDTMLRARLGNRWWEKLPEDNRDDPNGGR